MNILITGGSGFIGKNLVLGLDKNKYRLFSPSHNELNILNDNALSDFLKKNKIVVIVHAAVHSALSVSREDGFQFDMKMLASLLKNIHLVEKIIFFGSGAEYSKDRDLKKISENQFGKKIPQDLYGLSKYLTNEIIRREKKIVNLRLFGVYGPHEDYKFKFISNAVVKNLLKLPLKIKQNVIFDYLYINDLVSIVNYFIQNKTKFADYNITPIKSISLLEIAKIINNISDFESEITIENSNLNFQYTANNNRLLEEMSDFNFTTYRQGIIQLREHLKNIFKSVDKKAIKKDVFLKKQRKNKLWK